GRAVAAAAAGALLPRVGGARARRSELPGGAACRPVSRRGVGRLRRRGRPAGPRRCGARAPCASRVTATAHVTPRAVGSRVLRNLALLVADAFFPPLCLGCSRRGVALCAECRGSLPRLPDGLC